MTRLGGWSVEEPDPGDDSDPPQVLPLGQLFRPGPRPAELNPHMATYEYRADDGEVIEEQFPMGKAPPFIELDRDGAPRRFERVFSGGAAVVHGAGGVEHKGQKLPVSRSLPPVPFGVGEPATEHGQAVRKLGDGTLCTPEGRPIVRNKDDRKRFCHRFGYVDDN